MKSKADWHGSHYVREEEGVELDDSWEKKLIWRKCSLPTLTSPHLIPLLLFHRFVDLQCLCTEHGWALICKSSGLCCTWSKPRLMSALKWTLDGFFHFLLFGHSVVSNSLGPQEYSTPGFPVLHYLLEFAQTHVHCIDDAIQPSHTVLSPSPPALNLSQHHGFFQWVGFSHQVAKVLEHQLQHQSSQWTFRVDTL